MLIFVRKVVTHSKAQGKVRKKQRPQIANSEVLDQNYPSFNKN